MTLQVKLIILGIVAAIFLGLSWTAKYYHGKYVEATAEVAAQTVTINNISAAAKKCSDATKALIVAINNKEGVVKAAQEKAQISSKINKKVASDILVSKPSVPEDRCKSAVDLFKKYKADISVKPNTSPEVKP